MHGAVQVPVSTNVTCNSNRTCVFELVEDAFFNLEDSVITRSRHSFVTTEPDLLKVCYPSLMYQAYGPSWRKAFAGASTGAGPLLCC